MDKDMAAVATIAHQIRAIKQAVDLLSSTIK